MARLRKCLSCPLRVTLKKLYRCSCGISLLTLFVSSLFFCLLVVSDVIRQGLPHLPSKPASPDRFNTRNLYGGGGGGADGGGGGGNTNDFRDWANCTLRRHQERQLRAHGVTGDHAGYRSYLSLPVRSDRQVCVHPHLDPCDPGIRSFDRSVDPVTCSPDENWVFVKNGTFQISRGARARLGKITCEYAPIVRGRNDFSARHAEHIKPMASGAPLVSDFFKVACISPSGKRYHNIHAGIAMNPSLHARSENIPLPKEAMGYSLFMFGFDSVSRMSWLRNLPKTRDFFVRHLGGIELSGYNIVGDGTVQALLPILTGQSEHDLPTSRRGEAGAVHVDAYPWIWNDFKKRGYVTSWAEDMSYIGTFQYRLKGFTQQPTDHSMRTYFMLAEPMYAHHKPFCLGSRPRHDVFLGWFRDLYHMYGDKPKFMFGFHSEYSHNDNNQLKKIDDSFSQFLRDLYTKGHLDKTILVLMSDHGARFEDIRSTAQGKLEERMPYFGFRFPPSFKKRYPQQYKNFRANAHKLTTPFDIHETFHDVLNATRSKPLHSDTMDYYKRGLSLFQELPAQRTCADADIKPHWCACLEWTKVNPDVYKNVSDAVLAFINNATSPQRRRCAALTLKAVASLFRFLPNAQLLRFERSSDLHGDVPQFRNSTGLQEEYFQITLVTSPGDGRFEATVKHDLGSRRLDVNSREISRINRYGNSPQCIADELPYLRPYCYCV